MILIWAVTSLILTLNPVSGLPQNKEGLPSLQFDSVSVVGNFQRFLGCRGGPNNSGDWDPRCAVSRLVRNGSNWSGSFILPAGSFEYKVNHALTSA